MRYNGYNFEEVMLEHDGWVHTDCLESHAERQADFSVMHIRSIRFSYKNLTRVNFSFAHLENVIFENCHIQSSTFANSCLINCTFIDCTIVCSIFTNTHFYNSTTFTGCTLNGNTFVEANFSDTLFEKCKEHAENIWRGAILNYATIDSDSDIFVPMVCPASGSFIGWKKCYGLWSDDTGIIKDVGTVIVKLEILEDAERSSATTSKCRCSAAKVLDIQFIDGTSIKDNNFVAVSSRDHSFEYNIGHIVRPRQPFESNRFVECGSGIHFFVDRNSAVKYIL